ncbi:MAG: 5-(carboxyamino)imidazole ribonucleotide synthase [Pseudomonadota bacterium]
MSLPIGATIGILGGGQLGRMLAGAAAKLGFRTVVFAPGAHLPAAQLAGQHIDANYDDPGALAAFAATCDVVTLEWENVPVAAMQAIAASGVPVRPGSKALGVAQDRLEEKRFLERCGIDCAPWRRVDDLQTLRAAHSEIGPDAILKTRRDGYDGKGQVRLDTGSDLEAAWAEIGGAAAILEGFVTFEKEISVVLARDPLGQIATYTPSHNEHSGGVLRRSSVPADLSNATATDAQAFASHLAEALDYVGVLALEFFVLSDGSLLANEFAPRVHNSGHWTPEACATGQFENHIRAVAGWPLGATDLLHSAVMDNLIGEDVAAPLEDLLAGGSLTLYGKREIRPGRKMGHIVRRLRASA